MKKLLLTVSFISIALTSCESLITEVPPKSVDLAQEQIAVSCFISPQDTLITALVTFTNPLYSERKDINRSFFVVDGDTTFLSKSAVITTAKAFLTELETGEQVELLFEEAYNAYIYRPRIQGAPLRIKEGNYRLEVNVDGKKITAETSVPIRRNDFFRVLNEFNIERFGFTGLDTTSSVRTTSSIGWTYRKTEEALFRLRGGVYYETEAQVQENPIAPITTERTNTFSTLFFENEGIFDGSALSTSDTPQVSGVTFLYPRAPQNAITGGQVIVRSVHTELLTISQEYYNFYDSFLQNRDSNPFVEPTSIYSNIEGGIGIFAGSNGVSDVQFFQDDSVTE